MIEEFKQLISDSESIVITAHLGPDADSLCSSLLLEAVLKSNLPHKKIIVCMEEEYEPMSFLNGYSSVEFGSLSDSLAKHRPQLLIILDANNIPRCTRDPESVRRLVRDEGIKLAIIDHHEQMDIEPDAIYINQGSPAVTQDVYEISFDKLKLSKPKGYAQTAMVGIYSDTGGFTYDNPRYEDTFRAASQLISDGASTELAANQLTQYSREGLEVLNEILGNIKQTKDCTYTYISDAFYEDWLARGKPLDAIHEGFDIYLHNFIRNIEGRYWGFAIYPDPRAPVKTYSVSFRSLQGRVDVSVFARKLGGGGHKPAAGAKVEAGSVDEVLASVKDVIGLVE
ncbi:MAG TPA: DHH family phosphoesterase [Candidatus Saccharimonadales bacterium]|nr:DHH family phosphoesterase [Candidatus Saccharimonadales bacterium]